MVLRVSVISSRMAGSSMVDGMLYSLPLAMDRMVPRRILPERVFGSRLTMEVILEAGNRPDLVANHLHELLPDFIGISVHPCLQDEQAEGQLAFELVFGTEHGTFRHIRVAGDNLFHGPGGQTMAGDIDDIVHTAHDDRYSRLHPCSRRRWSHNNRGMLLMYDLNFSIIVVQGGQGAGRQRQLDYNVALLVRASSLPSLSRILTIVARHRLGG